LIRGSLGSFINLLTVNLIARPAQYTGPAALSHANQRRQDRRDPKCPSNLQPLQIPAQSPYSNTGVWRELVRVAEVAKIGHLGTHAFRHTYRSWLDAVGTPVVVQQKMMRHSDIRTTFNIYGDVVTDEMTTAGVRVARLAFEGIGAQTEREEG